MEGEFLKLKANQKTQNTKKKHYQYENQVTWDYVSLQFIYLYISFYHIMIALLTFSHLPFPESSPASMLRPILRTPGEIQGSW